MRKDFVYTVKLVVQHKSLGTLDFINKDFEATIELSEKDYYNPFVLNSENVLISMETEIKDFLEDNKYNREDIDIISYEVTTEDPYINIYFSEEEANNKISANPSIEAFVEPTTMFPSTPENFSATIIHGNSIEWKWDLVEGSAYRLYNQENEVITEIGLNTNFYIESNLERGQNYSRKIVAFNTEEESIPSEYVTVNIPETLPSEDLPLRLFNIGNIRVPEINPIQRDIPRLEAFKSGIGDDLDLKVKLVDELSVNEKFAFDIMLEGYSHESQKHYTAIPFKYKVKAKGVTEREGLVDATTELAIIPWPDCRLDYSINSSVYNNFSFTLKYDLELEYKIAQMPPEPEVYTPIGVRIYLKDTKDYWNSGLIKEGVIEDPAPIEPIYITKTKSLVFRKEVTINEPITNFNIGNFIEYAKSVDSEINSAVEGSIKVLSMTCIEKHSEVTINVDENSNILATCEESVNFYTFSKREDIMVEASAKLSDEDKLGQVHKVFELKPSDLKNKDNEPYTGNNKPRTEVTCNSIDPGLKFNDGNLVNDNNDDIEEGKTIIITKDYPCLMGALVFPSHKTYKNTFELSDEDSKRILFKDMYSDITNPVTNYTLEVTVLNSTCPYKELNFRTETTSDFIERGMEGQDHEGFFIKCIYNDTDYLGFSKPTGTISTEWSKETPVLRGSVNGREPMKHNGDGKLDFISVAPYIEIPGNVLRVTFSLNIFDTLNNKNVYGHFKNENEDGTTSTNEDIITFGSDEFETVDVYGKWTGPITKSPEFSINTAATEIVEAFVYNPLYDHAASSMKLSDVKILTRSLNPNVIVNPKFKGVVDFTDKDFKEKFEFEAKIISPSQNSWRPLVHSGHYYINNDEHFLYGETQIKEGCSIINSPNEKEFFVSIKANITGETEKDNPDSRIFVGSVSKSILCKIPMDKETHDITDYSLLDIVYPEIDSDIINPIIESIEVKTIDTDVELIVSDYNEVLKAKSLIEEYTKTLSNFIELNDKGEGFLSPAPQPGKPVIVKKNNNSLRQVAFFNEDGLTLTNTERIISDGRNAIALDYDGIDEDSLSITVDDKPIGIKKVINNMVYFNDNVKIKQDEVIDISYKLLNSFIVDYNYSIEEDKIKVKIHIDSKTKDYEGFEIYYETNEDGYYSANEIQLNPLYNDINAGFIYLSDKIYPLENLKIYMNPKEFTANKIDSSYFFVKATDKIGNAVSDMPIQITASHGKILLTDNVTNKFGIVVAKYISPAQECTDTITVINTKYDIRVLQEVSVKKPLSKAFVTASANRYIINAGETIKIGCNVFSEELNPFMAKEVILVEGSTVKYELTNDRGMCGFVLKPTVNSADNICKIKVSCMGVTENIDIKVVS